MILAQGTLLPDSQLSQVLSGLEGEIDRTRASQALSAEVVIQTCARLLDRLDRGELDGLLAQYATPQILEALARYRALLRPESLRYKLSAELGDLADGPLSRPFGRALAVPLGTLLHITAGNLDGLPAFSALEGLLTGNVNILKLPRGDSGLSLTLLHLLTREEPRLAPFLYAFSIPSTDAASLQALARLADGIVTWGGEEAIRAVRAMAPPGCKLIEWGHRLGFVYLSGPAHPRELAALARHIVDTGGLLCSSCQVVFLDTEDSDEALALCHSLLPALEQAALARHTTPGQVAQATLYGYEHFLEQSLRHTGAQVLRGRGCSVTLCPDRELELSPLYGNVLVKCLPRAELFSALRRQRGRLQTAGLICPPEQRAELVALLARAGVTRITAAGDLSHPFLGENHDGEFPLRRYVRMVDVEESPE